MCSCIFTVVDGLHEKSSNHLSLWDETNLMFRPSDRGHVVVIYNLDLWIWSSSCWFSYIPFVPDLKPMSFLRHVQLGEFSRNLRCAVGLSCQDLLIASHLLSLQLYFLENCICLNMAHLSHFSPLMTTVIFLVMALWPFLSIAMIFLAWLFGHFYLEKIDE